MDFNTLGDEFRFKVSTDEFGTLHGGYLSVNDMIAIEKGLAKDRSNLADLFLTTNIKKENKEPLTSDEVRLLSSSERELIFRRYYETNCAASDDHVEAAEGDVGSFEEKAVASISESFDKAKASAAKIVKSLEGVGHNYRNLLGAASGKSLFARATKNPLGEALMDSFSATRAAQDIMRPAISNRGSSHSLSDAAENAVLNRSDSSARSQSEASRQFRPHLFQSVDFPRNPIHETNEELRELRDDIAQVSDNTKSVEGAVIKVVNAANEFMVDFHAANKSSTRRTDIALGLAVLSLAVSAASGWKDEIGEFVSSYSPREVPVSSFEKVIVDRVRPDVSKVTPPPPSPPPARP